MYDIMASFYGADMFCVFKNRCIQRDKMQNSAESGPKFIMDNSFHTNVTSRQNK